MSAQNNSESDLCQIRQIFPSRDQLPCPPSCPLRKNPELMDRVRAVVAKATEVYPKIRSSGRHQRLAIEYYYSQMGNAAGNQAQQLCYWEPHTPLP